MKKGSLWFSHISFHNEGRCVKPYSTSQGGPEIKYILLGWMSGKESVLAMLSRPRCTSLAWRSVLSLGDLWSCPYPHLHVDGLGCCPYVIDGHKSMGTLRLVTGAWCPGADKAPTFPLGSPELLALAQPRTRLPLTVHRPSTRYCFKLQDAETFPYFAKWHVIFYFQ